MDGLVAGLVSAKCNVAARKSKKYNSPNKVVCLAELLSRELLIATHPKLIVTLRQWVAQHRSCKDTTNGFVV